VVIGLKGRRKRDGAKASSRFRVVQTLIETPVDPLCRSLHTAEVVEDMRSLRHKRIGIWLARLLTVMMFWPGSAQAIDFLSLKCKAAGDGWFEYQMVLHEEPLFTAAVIGGLSVSPGTNVVEFSSPPERWLASTNVDGSPSSSWRFEWDSLDNTVMPRPYTASFRFRSGHASWRIHPAGATIVMTLWPDLSLPFWANESSGTGGVRRERSRWVGARISLPPRAG
jgi:hypothetical protein